MDFPNGKRKQICGGNKLNKKGRLTNY